MMSKALQRKNYTKYYICTSYGVYGTYISYGTYNSVVSSLYTVYNKTIMQNEYMLSPVSSVDLNYHEKYADKVFCDIAFNSSKIRYNIPILLRPAEIK